MMAENSDVIQSKDECIEFTGSKNSQGYGRRHYNGKNGVLAHRVAYAESRGLHISELAGVMILHGCDNPSCVNPSHLRPGTAKDNVRDMVERGRDSNGDRRWNSNPRAKLTRCQVDEIKAKYVNGSSTHGAHALSREFGVDRATIRDILKGRSWLA